MSWGIFADGIDTFSAYLKITGGAEVFRYALLKTRTGPERPFGLSGSQPE